MPEATSAPLADPAIPSPEGPCVVDGCTNIIEVRQVMRSPTDELVAIGVCHVHYGLRDIMK